MSYLTCTLRLRKLRNHVVLCSEVHLSNFNLPRSVSIPLRFQQASTRDTNRRRFSSGVGREAKLAKPVSVDVSSGAAQLGEKEKRKEDSAKEQQAIRTLYKSVGILTGLQFVSNLGFGCAIPVLPLFAASLDLGPTGVGLILSISALSRLLMAIPSGRLSDAGYGR